MSIDPLSFLPFVITETRDLDPDLFAGLYKRQCRINLDLDVVDDDGSQLGH